MIRLKLASVLIVVTLLAGSLALAGSLSAGMVTDSPEPPASTSLGSSPGAAAPVLAAPTRVTAGQPQNGPRTDDVFAFPAVAAERRIEQNSVLIMQDALPWDTDAIEQILTAAGIAYDTILSDDIPFVDLSPYELVIIPSVQPPGFYDTLNVSIGKIEDYVVGGGKLWMSGCTQGATPLIPGGVTDTFNLDSYNVIVEPGHPWVQGIPNPMYGSSASHNQLTDLVPGTVVVATAQTSGLPVLIEYNLGAGHVAVTGQTLEFAWANGQDGAPILAQSLLYMFHFSKPWILNLTTTDVAQSAQRALNELGYSYYTHAATDWTGIDLDPYDMVMITMDGGNVEAPSVEKIRTDVIDRGKRAFFIGGTALQSFAQAVNDFLLPIDVVNFDWTVSAQPHWTLTNPDHGLADGLPGGYNYVNSSAAYYMLRATDPAIEVIGENGDGYPAFFYKRQAFSTAGAGVQRAGSLMWIINSPFYYYWLNEADYVVLKQMIANAIDYSTRLVYLPATLRNYPQVWDAYYEPNNNKDQAYGALLPAKDYLAYPNDTEDYYFFVLAAGKTVDIVVSNFAPTSTNGDLLLYDEALNLIDQFGQIGFTEMRLDDEVLGAGKYYIRVRTTANYSNSQLYKLRVTY